MASHKRNDSGVARMQDAPEDIDHTHDDARAEQMRAFINAAKELTSHDGYEVLTKLLRKEQELGAEAESHGRIVRRLNQSIDSLETAVDQGKNRIAELEQKCFSLNDVKIAKAKADSLVKDLEAKLLEKDKITSEQTTTIQALTESLATSQFEATSLQEEARKQQTRAENAIRRVEQLNNYRLELLQVDDAETASRLKDLWSELHKFAKTHFCVDLPDNVLEDESAWTDLDNLFPTLYLPRTNSQAAKNMRLAAVLSLLAEKIVHHLFDPTYSLVEESGMREALIRQAANDVLQERACRSVLLAMLQDEHQQMARVRKKRVHSDVWKVIAPLVQNEGVAGPDLERCIQESQSFWDVTKTLEDLHLFAYRPFVADDQEQLMRFPGEPSSKSQDGASALRTTNESVVVLTVLPHLYKLDKQVVPGLVVREYQTRSARGEIESQPTTLLRHMSQPKRSGAGRERS